MTGSDVDDYAASSLLDAVPVGVTIHDLSQPEAPVIHANGRFRSLTGQDRAAALGASLASLAGPEADAARLGRIVDRAAVGEPVATVVATPRAGGSTFPNRVRAVPLEDGNALLVHEDVSGTRDREATLDRYARRLGQDASARDICQRTAETAADLFGPDYCVVAVREGEWFVPRGAVGDVPPDLSRQLHLGVGVAGEAYRDGEARLLGPSTAVLDSATATYRSGLVAPVGDHGVLLLATTDPDALDGGDVSRASLLATLAATGLDRRDDQEGLEAHNERLATFADVVSHDLRNPLAVLDGSLELARETGDEDHFDRARRAVDRMDALVGSLRAQARHGEAAGSLATVDLVDVSETCWRTVATDGAELSVQTDRRIRADPHRLQQLLENLFRNAVEHGDAWHVRLGELGGDRGFYVADDGGGIPEADRESVFDPGYSTADGGTGFGLTICQQVAEYHGWELAVAGNRDGGARFEVTGVELVR